jgi:uncharacterized membrane protein
VRVGLDEIALTSAGPLYGVLVKVGLTETLAFVSGFAYGPAAGFFTGSLIIVISDLFTLPGPWTPFIATIIGLLGSLGGIIGRHHSEPTFRTLVFSAAVLTLVSEFLQNSWVALFYAVPIAAAMATGAPSLITALTNNIILFTALGPRIVKLLRESTLKQ